jgi:beta-glucosidase
VDWGRLMPFEPGSLHCDQFGFVLDYSDAPQYFPCRNGVQDMPSLQRYSEIFTLVRERRMSISLTLFHHSLPRWANKKEFGGWTNLKTVDYFLGLLHDVIPAVAPLVDNYVTLNEPAVFANL